MNPSEGLSELTICDPTVGDPAPKSGCLDRVDRVWTDMRPLSLRAAHRTEVPDGSSPRP